MENQIPQPGPLMRVRLLERSKAEFYEEARFEWDLDNFIREGDSGFSPVCDLCNNPHLKQNWIIRNIHTNMTMNVGSTCIKRFLILHGTKTQAETEKRIQLKEAEIHDELTLRGLYNLVVKAKKPYSRDFTKFRKKLMHLLEIRGWLHYRTSKEGAKTLIEVLFKIEHPPEHEIERLYLLMKEPRLIPLTREKVKRERSIKEGETWRKRSKVTGTTLSYSEDYKPR